MTRAIADQARTIRVPVHMVETINKLSRFQRQLTLELNREPTDEEIAQHLQILRDRPTISEAEKQQYEVVDDSLLLALKTNLEARVQDISALQNEISQDERRVSELNAQKGAADEQNNLFDKQGKQLTEAESNLDLLRRKFDIKHWESVLDKLLKLQEILPQYEAYMNASQELKDNESMVQTLMNKRAPTIPNCAKVG